MFFTTINQMMNKGTDLTIIIRKVDDQLMVSTLPKANGIKDEAQNLIVPLNLRGTAEELDANYFAYLSQPLQKANGLLENLRHFEHQMEQAAANSKAAKEQKEKEAKEEKEKKEKYEKLMKKAEEFITAKNYSDALTTLMQARLSATSKTEKIVNNKIALVKSKQNEGSLFDLTPQTSQSQNVSQSIPSPTPISPQPQPNTFAQPGSPTQQSQPNTFVPPVSTTQHPQANTFVPPIPTSQPQYYQQSQGMPSQQGYSTQQVYPQGQPLPTAFPQQSSPQGGYYGSGVIMKAPSQQPSGESEIPTCRPDEYTEYLDFPVNKI